MNYQNKDIFIVYTLDANRQPYLKRAYYSINEAQSNLQYGEFFFNTPIQLMTPFQQLQPSQPSVFPPSMNLTPQVFSQTNPVYQNPFPPVFHQQQFPQPYQTTTNPQNPFQQQMNPNYQNPFNYAGNKKR